MLVSVKVSDPSATIDASAPEKQLLVIYTIAYMIQIKTKNARLAFLFSKWIFISDKSFILKLSKIDAAFYGMNEI
jgi:hypothetical protein